MVTVLFSPHPSLIIPFTSFSFPGSPYRIFFLLLYLLTIALPFSCCFRRTTIHVVKLVSHKKLDSHIASSRCFTHLQTTTSHSRSNYRPIFCSLQFPFRNQQKDITNRQGLQIGRLKPLPVAWNPLFSSLASLPPFSHGLPDF